MTFHDFYTAIKKISNHKIFLQNLDAIKSDTGIEEIFKMTAATLLFEGFYQSLSADSDLKKSFLDIRLQRWKNHFGTPTVFFLTSYLLDIEKIRDYFKEAQKDNCLNILKQALQSKATTPDIANAVIINKNAISDVPMPAQEETSMVWLKTHNPTGGYTLPAADPFSQKFINHAIHIAKQNEKALEVGAAFGTATLKALEQGATIDCNDLDPRNLAVVSKRYAEKSGTHSDTETGDSKKLTLLPGAFPEELSGLKAESYQAILACRVLHFFRGPKIDAAMKSMASLLKEGGKLYIVCETPYQKNWLRFLPDFERRVKAKDEWPGEIDNSSEAENTGRGKAALPAFMHNLTKEVLERSVNRTGSLQVEECSYISRKGQFTEDAIYDGRESVGLIAVKRRARL